MAVNGFAKKSVFVLAFAFMLLIIACQKTSIPPTTPIVPATPQANTTHNSDMYTFCVNNNGTILSTNPLQCNYQGLIYFQDTDNAINLQFCTGYYDGCNNCAVENGTVTACTLMYCENSQNTPKCTAYAGTPSQNKLIFVNFTCNEGAFEAVFDNNNHIANMTYNMQTTELPQVVSASGAKYSNQKITFFTKGNDAFVFDAKNESKMIFENCSVV